MPFTKAEITKGSMSANICGRKGWVGWLLKKRTKNQEKRI